MEKSRESDDAQWQDSPVYRRGIDLLNGGRFFDAHELLEDVWRQVPPDDRQFLQGLIQIAVALHHHANANLEGASSVSARALQNLEAYPAFYGCIDVGALRTAFTAWRKTMLASANACPPVQVVFLA